MPKKIRRVCAFALAALLTACGPSPMGKHITQQINATKQQSTPAEIQAVLAPFFSTNNASAELGEVPPRIRALPIFADAPNDIMFSRDGNMLTLMIGSGFGHWGMIVIRPGSHRTYDGNSETASIPWANGVYFFSQYR